MNRISLSLLVLLSMSGHALGETDVTQGMLDVLQTKASAPFSSEAGRTVWYREEDDRSCTSCHAESVLTSGRHRRTGKIIEPMAPSVNPERLTDGKKINKWLLRNCKWTFGRECTPQEKGDVLTWLRQQ